MDRSLRIRSCRSKNTKKSLAKKCNVEVPKFAVDDSSVKIPAAWLIEQSGFQKGFSYGNAGISSNHTLAIINRGNASSAEIVNLMKTIQAGVREKFDIYLRPEPIFVGFDANSH